MLYRALRTLVLLALPVGVGTIIISQSFVDLLYGPQFSESGPVLAVLGVVTMLGFFNILMGRFALATGHAGFWSILMLVGIVLTFPLDLVLVPWADRTFDNGAIGGALSYTVTESVMLVAGLIRFARGALDRALLTRLGRCMVGAALMLLVGWPLRTQFFLVPALAAGSVYLVVILLTRALDAFERDAVRQGLRRVPVLSRWM
jgi:O-antigen/teichoic acid export membrane protein